MIGEPLNLEHQNMYGPLEKDSQAKAPKTGSDKGKLSVD